MAALRTGRYSDALINLGLAANSAGDEDEARAAWEAALRINPDDVDALTNLGGLHRGAGEIAQAIDCLERALAIKPHDAAAGNLALSYLQAGRFDRALGLCRAELSPGPKSPQAHSTLLLGMTYLDAVGPKELFEAHRRWDELHAWALLSSRRPHENDRDPDRALRIGYVSGDFRDHSVAYFIEAALKHHDRQSVRVFCYAASSYEDETTARLRALADEWRQIAALPDDRAAELIRRDGIDILVDLSGHTAGNRLLLFARKPAPVQVSWLGYPNTTGLSAMDYRLSDAIADPDGNANDAFYSEELVRLPACAWCFAPPADAPPIEERPASERITFGSFNNHPKTSERTVALWARLLAALPESRLLLKATALSDEGARRLLLERFAAEGIDADRLELRGRTQSRREHLASYRDIDIALDPVPYNGTATTCEALWMGVPVVTLAGDARHMSRVGASLLSAAAMADLVARTPEEFVEVAVELARDAELRSTLRRGLRTMLSASALCDGPRLARDLENAYRAMWRRWAAQVTADE